MTVKLVSYDWAGMIHELVTAGVSEYAIGQAMSSCLTKRMIEFYRRGAQPLYWRGQMLLAFWCATTGKRAEQAPTCEVVRGHRVDRRQVLGPRVQALPQWPTNPPLTVAPLRKKAKARETV